MSRWYLLLGVALATACGGGTVDATMDAAPPGADVAADKPAPVDLPAAEASAPDAVVIDDPPPDLGSAEVSVPDVPAAEVSVADVAPRDVAPAPMSRDVRCSSPRPDGAPRPPPLPTYSGGMCPTLVAGRNTLMSGGAARQFLLVRPTTITPGERLPVLFLWHWLGGSANGFFTRGNVQAAVDRYRFIGIIPEKKGDVLIRIPFVRNIDMVWPYLTSESAARVNEELTFFDDMLACVAAQHTVNEDCVSSVGVSAGALWTSQLMQRRSERLASAIVLSGGVGPASGTTLLDVSGWRASPPPRPLPTLVLWGGPTDTCAINFQTSSRNLERSLVANSQFVLECVHNCGHDVPPVEDPTLGVAALYEFAFDHPYWLAPRESPYYVRGIPSGMPTWCSLGAGSARPRTGACGTGGPACDIPSLP